MKYIPDNDLHIHSKISLCSKDEAQTPEAILKYAIENNIKTICLTDHFWDETVEGASDWYMRQNYEHICAAKPLPQSEGIRFLFGCETDLNKDLTLGLAKENFDRFDFVVIPTTHLHMKGFTISEEDAQTLQGRAKVWIEHLDALLNMDLPFKKIGIAHLACCILAPTREEVARTMDLLPEEELTRLFTKAAKLGAGIELNSFDMRFSDADKESILRPFRIAKECGCKFYFGSDAHHPEELAEAMEFYTKVIDWLDLTEDDKFII